jgi:hypothetical protein
MEQKTRGTPEKMGYDGVGCIYGTFNTTNKSQSEFHTRRLCGRTWGNDLTTTGWLLEGDHALTQTAIIKKTTVTLLLCQRIIAAWQHISLVKRFKKYCTPNATDGYNDKMWNGLEDSHQKQNISICHRTAVKLSHDINMMISKNYGDLKIRGFRL